MLTTNRFADRQRLKMAEIEREFSYLQFQFNRTSFDDKACIEVSKSVQRLTNKLSDLIMESPFLPFNGI